VPLVWQRQCRRGAPGDTSLTTHDAASDLAVPAELLRPALELAWAVANVEQRAVPPVPPPRPLRPLLRFAKLPDRALATVRRVLEEDEDFRARVAQAAQAAQAASTSGDAGLGRAGWLWLVRSEGWEEELAGLGADAAATAASARDDHEERNARKRLAAASEARVRAEATAAMAQAAAIRAGEELAVERQARRVAETRGAELEATISGLRGRLQAAEASAAVLEAALAESQASAAAAGSERDRLARVVAALETDLASARGRVVAADAAGAAGQADLARAIADAATAAQALGTALAAASGALSGESTLAVPGPLGPAVAAHEAPGDVVGTELAGLAGPSSRAAPRGPAARRQPAPLPPAVFDDSPAAAAHLVRVSGMALLVDGYNVSKRAWPDLAILEQRSRLTDALAELAARTGVETHLFFDGAEQPGASAPVGRPRSTVRTRFSPPDVDADEVIIEFVDQLPRHRPVMVATNDRRVQDEVRARGANVISAGQLLGLLGRAH
jgi:predicted RNA-binding protein with PIN domain